MQHVHVLARRLDMCMCMYSAGWKSARFFCTSENLGRHNQTRETKEILVGVFPVPNICLTLNINYLDVSRRPQYLVILLFERTHKYLIAARLCIHVASYIWPGFTSFST